MLGLDAVSDGEQVTFQRLPTHRHDLVEVYAPEFSDIRLIPDGADFVIAFVVDDIREAMAEVEAAGPVLLQRAGLGSGGVRRACVRKTRPVFWVRAPDGRIYVIQQIPD